MSAQSYIGVAVHINGRYFDVAEEVTEPDIEDKTEEVQLGGMAGPVEVFVGLQKLEKSYVFRGIDPEIFRAYGLKSGSDDLATFTDRIALSNEGETKELIHETQGRVKSIKQGTVKSGEVSKYTLEIAPVSHKVTLDGKELLYVHMTDFIYRSDGIDKFEKARSILARGN